MATTATTPTLVELDPRNLAAHPGNIRDDLGDLTELTASIRAVGVLEPIIITPVSPDQGNPSNNQKVNCTYRILAGHRRVAAAIKAKAATVSCLVRTDLGGDEDALTTMIVENVHRADLSATEEAAAYAQLAAFDLTPAQIAERTGRKAKTVRDALKLHQLPEQVKGPVADGTITLEQAAAIAKFADDEKAHARLLKAAESGYGLAYAIAEEKHRRDRNTRKTRNREALAKAGVTVIGKPKGFPYDSAAARVVDLMLADGVTRYDAAAHADCPGHAAFLDSTSGEPVLICRDPDTHGHVRITATNHVSPEAAQRREDEAQAAAERAEALTVAAEVRTAFIHTFLAIAKQPPSVTSTALLILFGYSGDLARNHPHLVASLLGINPASESIATAYAEKIRQVSPAKAAQHLLAHAAAIAETNLDRLAQGRSWGYRPALSVTWLDLLTEYGYEPSRVEQTIRDEAAAAHEEEEKEEDNTD